MNEKENADTTAYRINKTESNIKNKNRSMDLNVNRSISKNSSRLRSAKEIIPLNDFNKNLTFSRKGSAFDNLSKSQNKSNKNESCNTLNSASTIETMLKRFELWESKRKKSILEKQKSQDYERGIPKINKKKRFSSIDFDFITRQEKWKEMSSLKRQSLIEQEANKKAEMEKLQLLEINKKYNKKRNKSQIEMNINTIIDWETKRKSKIEKLKENENLKLEKICTFRPTLNRKSMVIAQNKQKEEEKINHEANKATLAQNIHTDMCNLKNTYRVNTEVINIFTESNAGSKQASARKKKNY